MFEKLRHQIKTIWQHPKKLFSQKHCVNVRALLRARVDRGSGFEDLGVISRRKVTLAFVNYIVDALQNSTTYPMDVFKYHDSGTGTNVESNANTVLQIPCAEARDVGTQVEGASANIFKTIATHTYAGTFAITEHGLFSAATTGTLMDRSVFAAINVVSGNKIEWTYELTINAEA